METTEFGCQLPKMIVDPPGPLSRQVSARLATHETPNMSMIKDGLIPIIWEEARGSNIIDVDGNRYVDLTAGFCVATVGHSNPRVADAIGRQAHKLMHSQGGANPNPLRAALTEKLAQVAPEGLSMAHVASIGAEAIEVAFKTARQYTRRPLVIAFQGGFHGKTLGALAATSTNHFREPFLPNLTGVTHIPYANCYRCPFEKTYPGCDVFCARYLQYVLDNPQSAIAGVAAVVMEPVQGAAGWIVPPTEFVQRVAEICRQRGILLISDEIITGFGRTGKLFGIQHAGVTPDILVVGKGMASGFPIAAMITRPEIGSVWELMVHSSTFMGQPMGCAAALASMAEIEERGLVQRSAEMGAYFKGELQGMMARHPLIGDVRGLGLMVAIEVVKDRDTKEPATDLGRAVVQAALNRGLMVTNYGGTYTNVIKLTPPLVITREQIDCALEILDQSFSEVEAKR